MIFCDGSAPDGLSASGCVVHASWNFRTAEKSDLGFFSDYFAPCHLPAYASAELVIPYWVPTLELGIYQGLGTITNAELTAVERALSIVKAIATNKNLDFDRLVQV